jgi:phosphatidate cytidylyltransferase
MRGASAGSGRALADAVPAPPGRWRDLGLRTASAAVLLPVALACLWAGGWAWAGLVLLGAAGMAAEWRAMCRRRPARWLAPAGAAYILPAVAALLWLRAGPAGFGAVLFVLCVVWASDIGAYLVGRLVGGAKLAPAISPGKTRSGAAGGLLAALAVGYAAARLDGGSVPAGMAAAAGLGIFAQAGDLLESALKRRFGVKDSGHIIPGHGGLLDRLDAVLLAAPAAALLAAMRGVELWR